MCLYSCFYCKAILQISQTKSLKGLRDSRTGWASEPFGFIKEWGKAEELGIGG